MPVIIEENGQKEEFLTIGEACEYLKITSQTLRVRAKALGIKQYRQDIAPNLRYYKKKDLDEMKRMRQVEDDDDVEENDNNDGHKPPSKTKAKAKKTQ